MHQTTFATPSTKTQNWYQIDATGLPVGRIAAQVAKMLQGKNKPEYTPHIDTGDFVIIINAEKAVFSGNKTNDKVYRYHTLFPGGLKEITYERMLREHPERIMDYAVRRMMPKTKMGKTMMKKLHIYVGSEHGHQAQNPESLELNIKRRA